MKRPGSIKNKLVSANLITVLIAFIIVGVIIFSNLSSLSSSFLEMSKKRSQQTNTDIQKTSQENMKTLQEYFENSLISKGNHLLARDSITIKPMFFDNSYNDLRSLLNDLFALDDEILSLDFFVLEAGEIKSWAFMNKKYKKGLGLKTVYDNETQSWVSTVNGQKISLIDPSVGKIIKKSKKNIKPINYTYEDSSGQSKTVLAYECTIPIFEGEEDEFQSIVHGGEAVGFLRYILTMEKMQIAISQEKKRIADKLELQKKANSQEEMATQEIGKSRLNYTLIKLAIIGIVILTFSLLLAIFISKKVSQPILLLKESAQGISQGDYTSPITVESDDEIGILGESFENMRVQVKEFTEDLQGMVDAKTKEISNLLNSIDQGIFTINPDLSVNSFHSIKAEDIYQIKGFHESNLQELFQLDDQTYEEFKQWLSMISQPRRLKRWKKYVELCPVFELKRQFKGQEKVIEIEYRPIIENDALARLMIISSDVTAERKIRKTLEKTKKEQELTLERVIGLIDNNVEMLESFFRDYKQMLHDLHEVELAQISHDQNNDLFRLVHTIKGNAGSLEFQEVAKLAGMAEDLLEELRQGTPIDRSFKEKFNLATDALENEFGEIQIMRNKLFSSQKDTIPINRKRFESLINALHAGAITDLNDVIKQVYQLDLSPFQNYCKKYRHIVKIYNRSENKDVDDLDILTPNTLVHRETMKQVDGAIVHLLRNSLDHGIETKEERTRLGKERGKVTISLTHKDGTTKIAIEDNGKGIDPEAVSSCALKKGLIDENELNQLSEQQKIELIFQAGFSSAETVTDFSGRGVGMDAVKNSIEEIGGKVDLETEIGRGTKITLTIPGHTF